MFFNDFRILYGFIYLVLGALLTACPSDDSGPVLSKAQLQVQPTELDFGEKDTQLKFTIKNIGQHNLTWTISETLDWVTDFQETSAKINGGGETQITVRIDRSQLENGLNDGKIQVTATADDGGQLEGGGKDVTVKAFKASPPQVSMSNNNISQIGSTSAKVEGFIDNLGSSDITEHGHVWSTKTNPDINDGQDSRARLGKKTGTGNFQVSLSNLTPKTTYYIRAYATNKVGTSYSSEIAFTTLEKGANNLPTSINLSNTTISEQASVNTFIGKLSSIDADKDDTHSYTLISGGSDFNIYKDSLRSSKTFVFNAKSSYPIQIRTTDSKGGTYEQNFTITIIKDNSNSNSSPTDIRLSNSSISESKPSGTVIGLLSTTDADAGDKHTYTLLSGGSDFKIERDKLLSSKSFVFSVKSSYPIRIKTDDGKGGSYEKEFTITITKAGSASNNTPTDIRLSDTSMVENNPLDTIIGLLSTTDADAGDTHTYTLVSGSSSFKIAGNKLRTSVRFDYETKNSYAIRIRTDDGKGGTYEKNFTIRIKDLAENRPFITRWKTTSNNQVITIPTTGVGYKYDIDWGDGSKEYNLLGNDSHSYEKPGTYTVKIWGSFPRISFGGHNYKIVSIEQWGDIVWSSMKYAFNGASDLVQYNATDKPNLSKVTDMSYMFFGASRFNGDIGSWDVSNVTNMSYMFSGAIRFNGDLSSWDVSNVTNMSSMFASDTAFKQDISSWDVSNVTSMSNMFYNGYSNSLTFVQDISSWNIAKVTAMDGMFSRRTLSTAKYNALLVAWSGRAVKSKVSFDAGNSKYTSEGEAGRNILTKVRNWSIRDGGKE